MLRARIAVRVFAPTLLLLASCGDPLGPGAEPITELPRALTASERAIIGDANAFGLALMADMVGRDDRPNVVLSPLSASMALGMTLNGAAGATFDAMRSTLGFAGLEQADINEAYHGLIELLTELDPAVRFEIANAIWAREGFPFHDAFFSAVRDAFDARVESKDFGDQATLEAINRWVSDHTDGRIDRILDQLDPSLVMLLVNAIYFEGDWTTQFDPKDTSPGDFRREDGTTVRVDMMRLDRGEVGLGGGANYQVLELPYGGEAFSMVILLPNGDLGVRDLLASLDTNAWTQITESLHTTEPDLVSIPKFTLSYDAYLNDALRAMGMDVAFRSGADFTRMSPEGENLCIDFVRQKTFIEVDERGTRAAAVTAVGVVETSFNGFIADRPFAFAVRERLTGTILFIGMVGDPTHEDSGAGDYISTCG